MSYLGRSAKLSLKAQEKVSFLATAGQTVKTGLSYTPSFVEVYVNGVLLTDTTDFTATNGNSITFTVALLLNDEVTVISLKTFTVADHYSKTEADTLLAAKSPIASPVFTGNVGIGTSASNAKLEVAASSGEIFRADAAGGAYRIVANQDGVLMNGNVGIGTASPSARFEVEDNGSATGNVIMKVTQDDQSSHYGFSVGNDTYSTTDSNGVMIHQMNNGDAQFNNAGALYQTVKNNATVVISTNGTGNHDKWEFDGGYYAASNRQSTTGSTRLSLQANGSQVGAIFSSGSGTAYNTTSDYRLKENVTPMSGATARVKLLKPCNFDWISTGENVDGFLAHEAQEVVPESVTGTKDAMKDEEYEVTPAVVDDEGNETTAAVMGTRSVPDLQGIDQAKLVPLLTATIQELIARIEALEGE